MSPLGWHRIRCEECRGKGIAEYIDVWPRPCDVCHGLGEINVPVRIPPIAWLGLAIMLLSLALLWHALTGD